MVVRIRRLSFNFCPKFRRLEIVLYFYNDVIGCVYVGIQFGCLDGSSENTFGKLSAVRFFIDMLYVTRSSDTLCCGNKVSRLGNFRYFFPHLNNSMNKSNQ
jgi:hypothetical protein